MVMKEICSDLEDRQISKLDEYARIAYRIRKAGRSALRVRKIQTNPGSGVGAKTSRMANKENSSATNSSFEPPSLDHCGALLASNSPSSESSIRNQEAIADRAKEDPAALSESGKPQATSKATKAAEARSEKDSREGLLTRSPPPLSHREELTRSAKEAAGAPGYSSHSQVPSKNSLPLLRFAESLSDGTRQGRNTKSSENAVERLAKCEEFLATGRKGSSGSLYPRREINTLKGTPTIPTLITHLGKGPRTNASKEADLQGPSLIDHGLELEA
jgi:hypothetical protein